MPVTFVDCTIDNRRGILTVHHLMYLCILGSAEQLLFHRCLLGAAHSFTNIFLVHLLNTLNHATCKYFHNVLYTHALF